MHGPHQQPEIQRGLNAGSRNGHHNTYLLSRLQSECEVLSAPALESCQYEVRYSQKERTKREKRMRWKGVKEMQKKLTYESCKITTRHGRGRLDWHWTIVRSMGTRKWKYRPWWKYRNEQVATPHRRYRYSQNHRSCRDGVTRRRKHGKEWDAAMSSELGIYSPRVSMSPWKHGKYIAGDFKVLRGGWPAL